MLVIRKDQMEMFGKEAQRNFEKSMQAHLGNFSLLLCKSVGEEQMSKVISLGIDRAGSHGFTFRGPVRFYLELMLLFGSHFDTDPQFHWAAAILGNQNASFQMQRAELLYEKVMDYRKQVSGPESAYALEAFRNIAFFIRQPPPLSPKNFIADMMREITNIYPQKAAYVGNEGLDALIRKGIGGAQRQRFTSVRGVTLIIMLMFAFGHGCGNDLLYPWIANTLKGDSAPTPEAKATLLEKNALIWLEHVLANHDKGKPA